MSPQGSLESVIADIRNTKTSLDGLAYRLKAIIGSAKDAEAELSLRSASYWVDVAFADSLVRLRLFIEQSLNYIEPMGLLSFTRYVFEMTVWLRLMSKDDEYGLLYGRELVKETRRHYKQLRDQLKREIPLLRGLEAGEGVSFEAELKKILEMPTGAGREAAALGFGRSVMHRTDRKASREFSLYHRKAATNGYAFQADLIADKLLPQLEKSLDGAEREWKQWGETPLKDERKRLLGTTKKGEEKPWVWSEQAKAAEMEHEYEFIYSYTSRLLHAGPMSITTNQKNLELQEVEMFLEYVHFRIVDISDMADRRLTQPRHLM